MIVSVSVLSGVSVTSATIISVTIIWNYTICDLSGKIMSVIWNDICDLCDIIISAT